MPRNDVVSPVAQRTRHEAQPGKQPPPTMEVSRDFDGRIGASEYVACLQEHKRVDCLRVETIPIQQRSTHSRLAWRELKVRMWIALHDEAN